MLRNYTSVGGRSFISASTSAPSVFSADDAPATEVSFYDLDDDMSPLSRWIEDDSVSRGMRRGDDIAVALFGNTLLQGDKRSGTRFEAMEPSTLASIASTEAPKEAESANEQLPSEQLSAETGVVPTLLLSLQHPGRAGLQAVNQAKWHSCFSFFRISSNLFGL